MSPSNLDQHEMAPTPITLAGCFKLPPTDANLESYRPICDQNKLSRCDTQPRRGPARVSGASSTVYTVDPSTRAAVQVACQHAARLTGSWFVPRSRRMGWWKGVGGVSDPGPRDPWFPASPTALAVKTVYQIDGNDKVAVSSPYRAFDLSCRACRREWPVSAGRLNERELRANQLPVMCGFTTGVLHAFRIATQFEFAVQIFLSFGRPLGSEEACCGTDRH